VLLIYTIDVMRRLIFIVFLCAIAFSCSFVAHAQTANDVFLNVVPEHPAPNQSVDISVQSYSFDIQTAFISWSIDGNTVASGIGLDSYTLTAKGPGEKTSVDVTITPVGYIPIVKSFTISPISVDMLWEATDSTVPPFYRGKALATSESQVKVVAIPQVISSGVMLPSSDFSYTWKEDYDVNQAESGYGKDFYTSAMDYLNPTKNIGVSISTRDGSSTSDSNIDLSSSDPKLVIYPSSPLLGTLLDQAVGNSYAVKGADLSVVVEPYFFSPGNPISPILQYSWQVNGNAITPATPNLLFLSRDTSQKGNTELSLSVSNLSKLFQEASTDITLSLQ